jgi:hypothetical protein
VAGRTKNTATSFFFGSFFFAEKKKEQIPGLRAEKNKHFPHEFPKNGLFHISFISFSTYKTYIYQTMREQTMDNTCSLMSDMLTGQPIETDILLIL